MLQTEKSAAVAGLRPATTEDAGQLVTFINRAFAPDNYFKRTERTDPSQVAEYLRKGVFFLLEDAGELYGLVYTELRENGRGYIGMIATDPDRQRGGIGTRLLQIGEEFCRDHGSRVIEISVINLRPDLVAWYQPKGYRVVGEAPYVRPEILILPCHFILMEKDLAPTPTADADNSN
ncbi:GNAT family N-acetyltransferase [Edaphobacter bradus]|uniref:GNAT family N-acetyltransferase n=1 Tax=Edaphobacter bradus TaxID=2259016 RepID=UPI0021E0FB90|nr:GNAT family N-acetyltransferase [Edaphobacter bradus]